MKKIYFFILAAMLMIAGTANAQKDAEHPWAGNYTLMLVDDEPYQWVPEDAYNYIEKELPTTFEVTIVWNAELNKYLVTKFYNWDVNNLTDGGLELKVVDDKFAQIITAGPAYHKFEVLAPDTVVTEIENEDGTITKDTTYYKETVVGLDLVDGTNMMNGKEPVEVMMNSDGQISLGAFKILFINREGQGFYIWSDGATPLNGGDIQEKHNYAGYYKVTADYVWNMEDVQWPETFVMEIAEDEYGAYLAQFVGYDVATPNFNAIYVDNDTKNPANAMISLMDGFNNIATINGITYSLVDGTSAAANIKLTYSDKDNTVGIDYFNIKNNSTGAESAYYFGGTATPISKEEADALAASVSTVKAATPASAAMYNLNGQRISAAQKGQLIITNGKKYLVK